MYIEDPLSAVFSLLFLLWVLTACTVHGDFALVRVEIANNCHGDSTCGIEAPNAGALRLRGWSDGNGPL